jgi:prenyltransferase beta subunit
MPRDFSEQTNLYADNNSGTRERGGSLLQFHFSSFEGFVVMEDTVDFKTHIRFLKYCLNVLPSKVFRKKKKKKKKKSKNGKQYEAQVCCCPVLLVLCLTSVFFVQEVNRLTLAYFVLNSLNVLGQLDQGDLVDKKKTIDWIYSLQVVPDPNAPDHNEQNFGFRGSPFFGTRYNPECKACGPVSEHDQGHLAMNYCALSLLTMLGDDLSRVNKKALLRGTRLLQHASGSFLACWRRLGGRHAICVLRCCGLPHVERLFGNGC